MTAEFPSLAAAAEAVLRTADAAEKTALSRRAAAWWLGAGAEASDAESEGAEVGRADPPDWPARPAS